MRDLSSQAQLAPTTIYYQEKVSLLDDLLQNIIRITKILGHGLMGDMAAIDVDPLCQGWI